MELLRNIVQYGRQHRQDAIIALFIFLGGALASMTYVNTWGGKAQFWQETTFTPAIMWLAGEGWRNPMVSDVPGLEAFLYGEVDHFDITKVPAGVRLLPEDTSAMTYEEINDWHPDPDFPGFLAWQRYHAYLIYAVTLCWLLFGVSWSALLPLCGLLYGTSCAAVYGIFRLGMGRFMAVVGALMILLSPLHLQMAPHLRDYAKAPFILLTFFLLAWLIKDQHRRTHILWTVAGLGALIGIGIGFRMDLLMTVPAVLVIIGLLRAPSTTWPKTAKLRLNFLVRYAAWSLVLVLVFFLALGLFGFPILKAGMEESGHFAHVALLGFLEYCDARLGVASELYSMGGPYSDYYMTAMVSAYSERTTGTAFPVDQVWSDAYHAGTNALLKDYVTYFPADILTRAYASVVRVMDELQLDPQQPYPPTIEHSGLKRLFDFHAWLRNVLPGGGRYYALLVFLILPWKNFRMALGTLFLFLFFSGYPGVQFNLRHYFFLEFVTLWSTAFLVYWGVTALKTIWLRKRSWEGVPLGKVVPGARRCILFAVLVVLGISLPLWGLRQYQSQQVNVLLDELRLLPLEFAFTEIQEDGSIVPTKSFWDEEAPGLGTRYALLIFEGLTEDTPITMHYHAPQRPDHFDFTHTITAPACPEEETITRVVVPIYSSAYSQFTGFTLPEAQVHHFRWMLHSPDAKNLPLWLWWTLGPDFDQQPRYQKFTRF